MTVNFFKIAYRNILRNKGFSFINISGLAIGMASAVLILLWIHNEMSHDKFHLKGNRIYTANNRDKFNGEVWADGVPVVFKHKVLVEPLVFAIGKIQRQPILAVRADVVGVFLAWLRGIQEWRAPPRRWIPRWRPDIVHSFWLRDKLHHPMCHP